MAKSPSTAAVAKEPAVATPLVVEPETVAKLVEKVAEPEPAPVYVPPEKLCGNCLHWQRMHQRAAVGQCLANSKFMSGPFYVADMNTCSLFKVGVV